MLRGSSGLSHKQARRQIATAETLGRLPAVREAVEAGKITFGNAGVLAEAERKTSAEDVQTDLGLLAQAQQMPEDQFARQARSWAAKRQQDHGEADFAQLRQRRFMRVWDGDDGMTHLKAAFDPVAGQRIRKRLEHLAARFHKHDKKHATKTRLANSRQRHNPLRETPENAQNSHIPNHHNNKPGNTGNTARSFEQCRADALEQLLTNNNLNSSSTQDTGGGRSTSSGSSIQPTATATQHPTAAAHPAVATHPTTTRHPKRQQQHKQRQHNRQHPTTTRPAAAQPAAMTSAAVAHPTTTRPAAAAVHTQQHPKHQRQQQLATSSGTPSSSTTRPAAAADSNKASSITTASGSTSDNNKASGSSSSCGNCSRGVSPAGGRHHGLRQT